jgi:hypothetical protein
MTRTWLLIPLLFVVACTTFQLRPDTAPSPIDQDISETRLEFTGCGKDLVIGGIACMPSDQPSIITEFPGDVIYFSSGANCSIRQQVRATVPVTPLVFPPPQGSICPVVVYYLPDYPQESTTQYQIKGLYGEVSIQPDTSYAVEDNFAVPVGNILTLQYPGAIRGAFFTRQLPTVQTFTGTTLMLKGLSVGTDLLQVRLWMADGSQQHMVYPGDWFSPDALALEFDLVPNGSKQITLQFSDEVSIVTVNHVIHTELNVNLPNTFTGIIRAYTVQGRTLLASIQNGVLLWSH